MILKRLVASTLIGLWPALMTMPAAHGAPLVTYEVLSNDIGAVDIEYFDGTIRRSMYKAVLPWRTTVAIPNPRSLSFDGAEIRADWRSAIAAPVWRPGTWVTVRVYIGQTLVCENSLDVGNAACYGSASFTT